MHHALPVRAFTLIELLVVIAIIAVLAALLLPAINSVRSSARSAQCASGQKQVCIATAVYAEDWEGVLSPIIREDSGGFQYYMLIEGYLEQGNLSSGLPAASNPLRSCKEWTWSSARPYYTGMGITAHPWKNGSGGADDGRHTNLNSTWGGVAGERCLRSGVALPSQRLLLADVNDWLIGGSGAYLHTRHRGRLTATLFDGHSETMTATRAADCLIRPQTVQ